MRSQKTRRISPPYIPKWDFMPLQKLCRLALLWQEAGFQKEASELAYWLFQWESFSSLWCPDKEYREEEIQHSFSLLRAIEPIAAGVLDCNISIQSNPFTSSAFTLDGRGTSLGFIRAEEVEIRAFGPQSASLSFGINGRGVNGWTRTLADPEVWLEMNVELKERDYRLDFKMIGLKPELPLSLAFYVKAQSCQIGEEMLKPKSLRRYFGEVNSILFGNKLRIESAQPYKVQIIPLAGEGCFWDCQFLLSFELQPFVSQTSFRVSL